MGLKFTFDRQPLWRHFRVFLDRDQLHIWSYFKLIPMILTLYSAPYLAIYSGTEIYRSIRNWGAFCQSWVNGAQVYV